MKKTLLLFLVSISSFAQVTIFEDSFETYDDFSISNFGAWQTLDLDLLFTYTGGLPTGIDPWLNAGDPQAFMIFNPTTALVENGTDGVNGETENRNFDPRTGAKYAACWAGVPSSNGQSATSNEDWLVSPVINLAGATGSSLSVWVKSMSDSYGLERYRIGVYVGTGTPTQTSDFTIISGGSSLSAPYGTWAERTQSLSAYDGQNIRIGILCNSADTYMFMVDDFKVSATSLSTQDFADNSFSVYPNPVSNVLNISNSNNFEIKGVSITDVNGRVVKNQTGSLTQVNVADLNAGVYFVTIEAAEGKTTKKFIKQ